MLEYKIEISKLPQVARRLAHGRQYVLAHDIEVGLEVACQSVVAACTIGQVIWLTELPKAYLDVATELCQAVENCLQNSSLQIFEVKTGDSNLCGSVLTELESLEIKQGSFVIIGCVDRFVQQSHEINWTDEVSAWKRWAEYVDCSVLWMYPRREDASMHQSDLLRLANLFSGYARLRKVGDEARYDVFYWFTHEGIMANKSYRLNSDHKGNWWATEREALLVNGAEPPVDEDDVFIVRAALHEGRAIPSDWRVFETAEQMITTLSSAHACTVVFHHNVGTQVEPLAHSILELRRMLGPHVKIVVKKSGGRLRHSSEMLLLNMGANLLIPSDMSFARMLNQLKLIQGQVFVRSLPSDFEAASSGMKSETPAGYFAPDKFITIATEVMKKTQRLEVHNALIRLFVTSGLSVLDTLRSCTIRRSGDLFTADQISVYVFLSACEEHDIEATLERVFRLPVSVIFSEEARFTSSKSITMAISELHLRAQENHFVDHSNVLDKYLQSFQIDDTHDPTPLANNSRMSIHRPFTSVPRALKLRSSQT